MPNTWKALVLGQRSECLRPDGFELRLSNPPNRPTLQSRAIMVRAIVKSSELQLIFMPCRHSSS
jgi:hypothetical protein